MKKLLFLGLIALMLGACNGGDHGELVGVQGRDPWYDYDPYGTLYCPMGSYNMGQSDQDMPYNFTQKARTVSVQAFYMDQTEISNNEYRQFVYWVRDSTARELLGALDEEKWKNKLDEFEVEREAAYEDRGYNLIWEERLDYANRDEEVRNTLNEMYLPVKERYYTKKQFDTRKLNYLYYRIDLKKAARKVNRFRQNSSPDPNDATRSFVNGVGHSVGEVDTTKEGLGYYLIDNKGAKQDRSVFIIKDVINVYPDTLAWVHDFTYSFNEPMTNNYFWHPAYDNYPVVGVTWKQCRAFCVWRTQYLNGYFTSIGRTIVNDFRLPTESEWEYGARGGLDLSPYPWGGPYIRNARGCFLGNFKPMRGNYIPDGGFHTVDIWSYSPNEWGFYNMAGNAAEWTSNAFEEAAYDFEHDLNSDYTYEPTEDEKYQSVRQRKVIRGGSWKDVGFYLQTSSRTYEYQDTAKCYIGFRCVMTYLGRARGDDPAAQEGARLGVR
ncbi:MAG TPA: SUMF1/EgtB/PvdO family nonheme iron enzyme [Bacteroidia bacterium]|nr:SUMF1/EgtB/PvdO family nonheme iron enzyme [Bacteroidia bacterium]